MYGTVLRQSQYHYSLQCLFSTMFAAIYILQYLLVTNVLDYFIVTISGSFSTF